MLDRRPSRPFRPDDPARALGLVRPAPDIGPAPALADAALAKRLALLEARLAKAEWLLQLKAPLDREAVAQGLEAVLRLDRPSPAEFFDRAYAAHRPALITGWVDRWPAMTRWSWDGLRAIGNPEVEVQGDREADRDYELQSIAHKRRRRWHEVIAIVASGKRSNDLYLTANNTGANRQALAALWADMGELPGVLARDSRMGDGFFWMGPRGTITPWHHDLTQNLLVQIVGTKRVLLASPAESPKMANHRHCFSAHGVRTDFSALAPQHRPLVHQVELGPGEALFLPVGWWHHVEALTPTVGASFTNFVWWNDFAADYRSTGPLA